ncbi:MAG TPA: dihydropteroate synthase [Melioribacteraceae bacterium]|nr:dihydropteroate synthase [Melioribacteraceae bacterium]
MVVQLVDIFYSNVFKRYSSKYNIFRDLYEKDMTALEIRDINYKFSQKVKKIILSNREICYTTDQNNNQNVDLLVLGSLGIFKQLSKEIIALGNEDVGFKINKTLKNISDYDNSKLRIGNKSIDLSRSYLMGILNVTPDSFSDGGKYLSTDAAVEHGIRLLEDGASILDVGGESSRPGSEPVEADVELSRVIPVVEGILKNKKDAIVSIDTQKSIVASEALSRGVKIVNDISAGSSDPNMLNIVKKYDASFIIMHMKGNPKTMQSNPEYDDVVSEVYDFLLEKIEKVRKYHISNIIIDPGIGFGKRVMDNYELIKRLSEFKGLGAPLMVGLSKKSFLGKSFNLSVEERDNPTLAAETIAIKNGAKIIRTHDVKRADYSVKLNHYLDNPEVLINV